MARDRAGAARCKEVVVTTEGHILLIEVPALATREVIAYWANDVRLGMFWTARLRNEAAHQGRSPRKPGPMSQAGRLGEHRACHSRKD